MPLRHLTHVPPRQYCDCGYSLQNRVNSITLCITLNAKTGKIVLVTLCIQTEWLFWMFVWCETVPMCLSIDSWTALGYYSAIFFHTGIRTPDLRQSGMKVKYVTTRPPRHPNFMFHFLKSSRRSLLLEAKFLLWNSQNIIWQPRLAAGLRRDSLWELKRSPDLLAAKGGLLTNVLTWKGNGKRTRERRGEGKGNGGKGKRESG